MTSPSPARWLVLLCAGLLGLGMAAAPASAADRPEPVALAAPPRVVFGGLTDNVFGNRSRMIQLTFVAFGIGVLILVTASRKH